MTGLIPQRPLLAGLEPKHFAHPLDVSARRRMDRLIAGNPRMEKRFASLERSLADEEYLRNLAYNTRRPGSADRMNHWTPASLA